AVVPLHALPQLERQRGLVLAPRPAACQIRHDRLEAVLRDILFVQDEIVEDSHERGHRRVRRLFENRGAWRTIPMIDLEYAAVLGLAGAGRREGNCGNQQRARRHRSVYPTHCKSSLFAPVAAAQFFRCARPWTEFRIDDLGAPRGVRGCTAEAPQSWARPSWP